MTAPEFQGPGVRRTAQHATHWSCVVGDDGIGPLDRTAAPNFSLSARATGRFRSSSPGHPPSRPDAGAPRPRTSRAARSALSLDAFDAGVLGAFTLLSFWLLAVILVRSAGSDSVWTGVEGSFVADQAQISWVRDSAHQVLIADLFQL